MECGRTIHADGSLRRRQLLRKRRGTLCSPDLYGMAWFHAIVGPNIARQPIAVSSEERLSQAAGGRRHFSAILKKPLQGAGWLYCGTVICRHHLCIQRLRQRVELVRCTNTVARGNPDPQALALIADRTWAVCRWVQMGRQIGKPPFSSHLTCRGAVVADRRYRSRHCQFHTKPYTPFQTYRRHQSLSVVIYCRSGYLVSDVPSFT